MSERPNHNHHGLPKHCTLDDLNSANSSCEGHSEGICKHRSFRDADLSQKEIVNENKNAETVTKKSGTSQTFYQQATMSSVNGVVDTNRSSTTKNIHKKDMATSTENEDDATPLNCKYCKTRMSNLILLEKVRRDQLLRRFRRSADDSSRCHLKRKPLSVNKSCQTSPGLFHKAKMTDQEFKSLAIALHVKNKRTNRDDTFCKCVLYGKEKDCHCGESDKHCEWVWDPVHKAQAAELGDDGCLVLFHKDFSCGTSAVRGNQAMRNDQYFWEIKMTTRVYGTDMMIGVGTDSVDLNSNPNTFCSMLGYDVDSWGISYEGQVQHAGHKREYCSQFGQGAIIGVHLDMWHGTVAYFKNRQALGTAFTGLRGRTLYPMACSTAARSGMKIISTHSFPTSLQFMCSQKLRQCIPSHLNVLDVLDMPPGLKAFLANNVAWLLDATCIKPKNVLSHYGICSMCLPLEGLLKGLIDYKDNEDKLLITDLYAYVPSINESIEGNEEKDPLPFYAVTASMLNENSSDYSEGNFAFGFKRFKHDKGQYDVVFDNKEMNDDDMSKRGDKIKIKASISDLERIQEEDSDLDEQSGDVQEQILIKKRKRSQ